MSYAPTPRPKPTPKRSEKRTITAPLPQNVGLSDDHGGVDHDKVTIPGPKASGGAGSVTWSSNHFGGATIKFDKGDGSPFASTDFVVPADGSVNSGPAIRGGAKKPFRYSVYGEHGHNDPVIVVDP